MTSGICIFREQRERERGGEFWVHKQTHTNSYPLLYYSSLLAWSHMRKWHFPTLAPLLFKTQYELLTLRVNICLLLLTLPTITLSRCIVETYCVCVCINIVTGCIFTSNCILCKYRSRQHWLYEVSINNSILFCTNLEIIKNRFCQDNFFFFFFYCFLSSLITI
jgi:hypothetical protein